MSSSPWRKQKRPDIRPAIKSRSSPPPRSRTPKTAPPSPQDVRPQDARSWRLPTLGRRFLAWSLEAALLTASVAVPFSLGSQLNQRATNPQADLTPTLQWVQTQGARALGLPPRTLPRQVPHLTNVLWTGALGLPLILMATHVYSISRYGRSWPKQWLGVQVLSLDGQMPGWRRTLLREGVGKISTPLLVAYGVWQVSGAFPMVSVLLGLGAIAIVGESLTGLGNRPRRSFHDWIAGTCVVDRETGAMIRLSSLWNAAAAPKWGAFGSWAQAVGPTAVVMNPDQKDWNEDLTLAKVGLGLGVLLTLGGLVGVGSYWVLGRSTAASPAAEAPLYDHLVATLTNPELDPAARRAAVLALGNVADDRVTPLLVDLIAQTDDVLWLDALQQAVVAQGPAAFPPLRRLNQSLSADLAMQVDPTLHRTTIIRLQTVNRIVTKLILLESSDRLDPVDLSRMHLGFLGSGHGDFRLALENQNLGDIHWQGSVLTRAQFQGAKFYDAGPDDHLNTYDDRMSDLSGANLTDANLSGADLTLSQFVNAGLLRATFNRANLTLANLQGANLEQAHLVQAVLDQANLSEARLSKADLTEAELTAANLANARLSEVSGAGAQMIGANLAGATANAMNLTDADLSDATLTNTDFTGAALAGANLRNANLSGATLRDADLRNVELRGANLSDTDFAGALFTVPTAAAASDGFVEAIPSLETGDQFAGVDFTQARNLDPEQINFICAQNGIHSACSLTFQE